MMWVFMKPPEGRKTETPASFFRDSSEMGPVMAPNTASMTYLHLGALETARDAHHNARLKLPPTGLSQLPGGTRGRLLHAPKAGAKSNLKWPPNLWERAQVHSSLRDANPPPCPRCSQSAHPQLARRGSRCPASSQTPDSHRGGRSLSSYCHMNEIVTYRNKETNTKKTAADGGTRSISETVRTFSRKNHK